jgi:hypothetical protein
MSVARPDFQDDNWKHQAGESIFMIFQTTPGSSKQVNQFS